MYLCEAKENKNDTYRNFRYGRRSGIAGQEPLHRELQD